MLKQSFHTLIRRATEQPAPEQFGDADSVATKPTKHAKAEAPVTFVTVEQFDVEIEVSAIVAAQSELASQRAGFRDGSLTYRLDRFLSEVDLQPAVRAALKRRLKFMEDAIAADARAERAREANRKRGGGGAFHF